MSGEPAPAPPEAPPGRNWFVRLWSGEVRPTRPAAPPAPDAGLRYLWLGIAVVVGAVVFLELVYAQWPVPPGVDSGDWIQRSFAWVGLAHPPMNAVGSPYLYNPLMFPVLGVTVLAAGGPTAAGFVFGGFLLLLYGLSVLHLSRRYLLSGPFQFLFVGLALLNGTTLQILFWGGYPNFLALVFFNEALVFLLAFLRSRSTTDALLLYGFVALTFLTHDLTFAVLILALATTALFLLLRDRGWFSLIFSPGNVAGLAILAATVVGYDEITKWLSIPHPGYFSVNPAAYYIDNLGEYFRPLASAPMFLPGGSAANLSPREVEAFLVGVALALTVGLWLLARARPTWVDHRHFVAVGVTVSTLLVPVVGWVLHVDTDYTRFVYFLPLPVSLLIALTAEGVVRRRLARPRDAAAPEATASRPPVRWSRPTPRETYATVGVAFLLVLLFANVTAPMALSNEQSNGGSGHDAMFLQATNWLSGSPTSGSVMTTQGAVRWVEALTDRGAFDIGPTWLLFEPWQIVNAEEAYWAFNAEYAVTNNVQVLSFSGPTTTSLLQMPMYSAYVQGVQFPVFRLPPSDLVVNVTTPGGTNLVPANALSSPALTFPTGSAPSGRLAYTTSDYTLNETGTVGPGGVTWVNLTVDPDPGDSVGGLSLVLANPPAGVSLLHLAPVSSVGYAAGTVYWNDTGTLGQLPGKYTVASTVTATPVPIANSISPLGAQNQVTMTFENPDPAAPFTVSLAATTVDESNPAIVLPTFLNATAFFAENGVRFLLLPPGGGFTPTESYFTQAYGFDPVFGNSEWTISEAA